MVPKQLSGERNPTAPVVLGAKVRYTANAPGKPLRPECPWEGAQKTGSVLRERLVGAETPSRTSGGVRAADPDCPVSSAVRPFSSLP